MRRITGSSNSNSSNSNRRRSDAENASTSRDASSSSDRQSYSSRRRGPPTGMSQLERTRYVSEYNTQVHGSRWSRQDLCREHYTDSQASNAHRQFMNTVAELDDRFGSAVSLQEPGASTYRQLTEEAASIASEAASRNMRGENSSLGRRGAARDYLIDRMQNYSRHVDEGQQTIADSEVARPEDFDSSENCSFWGSEAR